MTTSALPDRLPPEAPLAMPEQRFDGNEPATIEVSTRPHGLLAKRLLLISATAVIGMQASTDVRYALSVDGNDPLDIAVLALFLPLLSWIAFGFVSSLVGFIKLITGDHPGFAPIPEPIGALRQRTAILMPVYNESVEDIFARVEAMATSVAAAGGASLFDFFVLSDSSELHGKREEEAWAQLAPVAPIRIYYRRRPENVGKKPGNIAEWVRRFGGAYAHMIVLDADSMMSGSAMVGMASIMENKPSVGLLQTVPMIINARTFFQRWTQFATYAYGPIASAGLLWWSGSEAVFWGHNAIIRTKAFADCCGLPELPGKAPFGGHIQSHDVLEAALLRRRGWAVHMVMIDGSYEEYPPTIIHHAIRDRRWAQGNLQHLRLLDAVGFHWTSRLHLLIGASAYLTSPAWLLLILLETSQSLLGRENLLAAGPPSSVLVLTVLLLFGPKIMGIIWVLAEPARRASFGGTGAVLKSALIEIPLSILQAPVIMVTQTKALFGILFGIPSTWTPQTREVDSLAFRDILPKVREHIMLGVILLAAGYLDPITGLWLSPVILGLLSAPLLIIYTSSAHWGDRARARGYFTVPPPVINDVAKGNRPDGGSATTPDGAVQMIGNGA